MHALSPWTNPVSEQGARRRADAGPARWSRPTVQALKKTLVNTCRKHQTSSLQLADFVLSFTTRALTSYNIFDIKNESSGTYL